MLGSGYALLQLNRRFDLEEQAFQSLEQDEALCAR